MKKRRFLASVLCLCMVLGLLPTTALAVDEGDTTAGATVINTDDWTGCTSCSEDNPHMIYTTADLDKIRTHTDGHFKLANDIEFKDEDFEENGAFYNNGLTWNPIGCDLKDIVWDSSYFSGTLDGDGHSIKNLKLCPTDEAVNQYSKIKQSGLFYGLSDNAKIQNLIIDGAENTHPYEAAIVFGKSSTNWKTKPTLEDITIKNCALMPRNSDDPMDYKTGFLCGSLSSKETVRNITIENCRYQVDESGQPVEDVNTPTGLIAGSITDSTIDGVTIKDCQYQLCQNSGLLVQCATRAMGSNTLKNVTVSDTTVYVTGSNVAWIASFDTMSGSSSSIQVTLQLNNVDVDVTVIAKGNSATMSSLVGRKINLKTNDNVSLSCIGEEEMDLSKWWESVTKNYNTDQYMINNTTQLSFQDENRQNQAELLAYGYSSSKYLAFYVKNAPEGSAIQAAPDDQYLVAFLNGGTFADGTKFAANKLATPIREGYLFDGWYDNADCTGTAVTSGAIGKNYYAKWIQVEDVDAGSIQYDGTADLPTIAGVTLSNWKSQNPDIVSIENDKLKAIHVGTATITADAATTAGGTVEATFTIKVTPRVLVNYNQDGDKNSGSISYAFSDHQQHLADLLTVKWKDAPNTVVTLTAGTDTNYTYTVPVESGGLGQEATVDFLPMPVGQYTMKLNMLNPNYTFAKAGGGTTNQLTLNVKVAKAGAQRAYLVDVAPTSTQFVYDGTGKMPVTGTLNAYAANSSDAEKIMVNTVTVSVSGRNDTVYHKEKKVPEGTQLDSTWDIWPQNPGTYVVTIAASNDTHYIYKSQVFVITKATVTVKADDKLVYVGDDMPQFTYTVSGLADADTLSGEVSLACAAENTNEPGTYTITPSGASVPNTEFYNETIQYETGTLTIRKESSGGGASHPEAGSSSSSSTRYEIEKPSKVENGSIKVSDSKAEKGDIVTITVIPDEGYALDKLAVYDEDGDEIDLEDEGDGEYTFEMPKSDVEIEVSFAAIENETVKAAFTDVASDAWYADAVQYVFENGMMSGTSETTFSPNLTTTRGMIVTILYRLEGEPAVAGTTAFTDVAADQYYANAVAWAAQNGIVAGIDAATFAPNRAITREQMAAILYRYAQFKGYDVSVKADLSVYTDAASVGTYATDAMAWANGAELITGTSATTLSPADNATRVQVAAILMRFCENIAK